MQANIILKIYYYTNSSKLKMKSREILNARYYLHEGIENENGSKSIRTEQQSRDYLSVLRFTELFAFPDLYREFSMKESIYRYFRFAHCSWARDIARQCKRISF